VSYITLRCVKYKHIDRREITFHVSYRYFSFDIYITLERVRTRFPFFFNIE
jgi:hypothetical protein